MPIRIPDINDANSLGELATKDNPVFAKAIRHAADHHAQVINVSQELIEGSSELTAAVKYAMGKGSLIFASVGEGGDVGSTLNYPSATPGVVGVGAVNKEIFATATSQKGEQVDVSAPGVDMVHACGTKMSKTGFCKTAGTGDATALASASAALIWAKHPNWTNNQVLRVLVNTSGGPTDGSKRNYAIGYGVVRPRIALPKPGNPGPALQVSAAGLPGSRGDHVSVTEGIGRCGADRRRGERQRRFAGDRNRRRRCCVDRRGRRHSVGSTSSVACVAVAPAATCAQPAAVSPVHPVARPEPPRRRDSVQRTVGARDQKTDRAVIELPCSTKTRLPPAATSR